MYKKKSAVVLVLAQRGGSCSIVLTANMFSSSSTAQRVSNAVFFPASAAHVQEHTFAFNALYFSIHLTARDLIATSYNLGPSPRKGLKVSARMFLQNTETASYYFLDQTANLWTSLWPGCISCLHLRAKTTGSPLNGDRTLSLSHTAEEEKQPKGTVL